MNVRASILRHSAHLESAVTICLALVLGLYTNLLSAKLADTSPAEGVLEAICLLRYWNFLLLVAAACVVCQQFLTRLPIVRVKAVRDEVITAILEAACKSIVYPVMTKHIRAIITLRDKEGTKRITRYAYNIHGAPERVGSYPLEFGVTGDAYVSKTVVARELPTGHHATYPQDVQRGVLSDIRSILAAPILANDSPEGAPLGVLAFDSILPLTKIRFNTREVRELAQQWADIVAVLLRATEV